MSGTKTILIIDDEHDIRVALRDCLESEGYFVHSAADGHSGLNLLRSIEPPAMIFLDLMMPILNGQDFLKIIKSNPVHASIPTVIISANREGTNVHGATAYLRKPIELNSLLTITQKYCNQDFGTLGSAEGRLPTTTQID